MNSSSSVVVRIGVAKGVGFSVGLVGFFAVPFVWPDESLWLRFGLLFWYTTLGAVIGMAGMIDSRSVLKVSLPFWVRGPVYGAWLNFVLALLMYEKLAELMKTMGPPFENLESPYWIVLEGAVVGFLADWIATRFGGEGQAS